jgi:hypothetical protein
LFDVARLIVGTMVRVCRDRGCHIELKHGSRNETNRNPRSAHPAIRVLISPVERIL